MSNNTKWVVGVIVVIVIVAILWYAFGQRNETATNETPATGTTEQTAPAPATDGGTTGGTTDGTTGGTGTTQ